MMPQILSIWIWPLGCGGSGRSCSPRIWAAYPWIHLWCYGCGSIFLLLSRRVDHIVGIFHGALGPRSLAQLQAVFPLEDPDFASLVILQRDSRVLQAAHCIFIKHLTQDSACVLIGEDFARLDEIIPYLRLEEQHKAHSLREVFGARGPSKSSQLIAQME